MTVTQPAKRDPRAAEMMAYLRLHKDEVRAAVRAREGEQVRLPVEPDAGGVVLPEPDADGVVRLVRVSPEVAFAAGDLINDGKAELIGNVIYRRLSNVFDVTYRVVGS